MLKSYGWMAGWHSWLYSGTAGYMVVAHEILVTAQRPNSFFPIFGFDLGLDFGLGLNLRPWALKFCILTLIFPLI